MQDERFDMRHILAMALAVVLAAGIAGAQDYAAGNSEYEKGNYAAAMKEWRPLAEKGDPFAQVSVGLLYYNGKGAPQDYAEAVHWYRRAAEAGFALGQYSLGYAYSRGEGVSEDNSEAVRWYRGAALQGLIEAQFNLGVLYAQGKGIPQNKIAAHAWFNIVCARDIEMGCDTRDVIAETMRPSDIASAQQLARACMESDYKDCE